MKKSSIVFTLIRDAEEAQAQAMLASVKKFHPQFDPRVFRLEKEGPRFQSLVRTHGLEGARALWIPKLAQKVFEAKEVRQALYLDPSSYLYRRLDFVHSPSPRKDIALILGGPAHGSLFDSGIVWMRRSDETHKFLKAWEKTTNPRFLDLCPALYESVDVIREPSVARAYWNLNELKTLTSFNFRGFDPERPYRLSRDSDIFADNVPGLRALIDGYRNELQRFGKPDADSDSLILWS